MIRLRKNSIPTTMDPFIIIKPPVMNNSPRPTTISKTIFDHIFLLKQFKHFPCVIIHIIFQFYRENVIYMKLY